MSRAICRYMHIPSTVWGLLNFLKTKLVYSLFASQHKYYVHSDSIRGIKVNTPAVYPCALTLGVNIWSAPYFLFAGLMLLRSGPWVFPPLPIEVRSVRGIKFLTLPFLGRTVRGEPKILR